MKKLTLILGIAGVLFSASAAHAYWQGESNYLRCNPDVANAVYRGDFRNGYEHYQRHGRYESRVMDGNCHGRRHNDRYDDRYDDRYYNDRHYDRHRRDRDYDWIDGFVDIIDIISDNDRDRRHRRDWDRGHRRGGHFNESGYLRCNPDVRDAVRRGDFRSGRHHYRQHGQYENRRMSGC